MPIKKKKKDPSSLASKASLLLVNLKSLSYQSPQNLASSLLLLHWLLRLLHLKYSYFNCGMILEGRETSILYLKLLEEIKVSGCSIVLEGFK